MTRTGLRVAFIVTLGMLAMGVFLSFACAQRFYWGPPEFPKAQGEAFQSENGTVTPGQIRYREETAAALIREPQNTWSNLAFVFAGAGIAASSVAILGRCVGIALMALGIASGLYHASLLSFWRTIDVATMGWAILALALLGCASVGLGRLLPKSRLGLLALSLVAMAAAIVVALFRNTVRIGGVKPMDSTYVTAAGVAAVFVLLAGALLFGARTSATKRPLMLRLCALSVVTLAAIIFQLGDHPGHFLCRPNALIQGHAAWHVLMAFASWLAYDTFATIDRERDPRADAAT